MHRPLPHAPGVLAENRRHYELLVETALHHADRGDVERLLRATTIAANYAWLAPVGLLSDLRLERAVMHAVRGSGVVTADGDRRGGRVLHVLSEAYAVGGHTRQATQWVKRDVRRSDVVLTNQHGRVTETTIANLAVRLDGTWWTPPVSDGCLPGVERGRLLDEGVLRERSLAPDDLRAADGLAVVSSLRGWRDAVLS